MGGNSIINRLDLFGVSPKIYVDHKNTYQTKFGVFLTLVLVVTLILSCWVYGKDIIYRENPTTTVSEILTGKEQARYNLAPNTFNFGIGLQNSSWEHYIDESIYTLKIVQSMSGTRIKNGQEEQYFEQIDLNPRPCKRSDFKLDSKYFDELSFLENLYCIDKKDDIFLQGDFGGTTFSSILIYVQPCKNSDDDGENAIQCKSEEEINQALAGNFWAIYFTDQILDPKNYETPFQIAGRDLFGITQNTMFKQVDIYFRNVWVQDNTGFITPLVEKKRGLSYSYEKEDSQNTPQQGTGEFLRFNLRLEKTKETKVYRTYINIAEILAKIGGILKFLMVALMIISYVVSQKLYNLRLVNDVFIFRTSKEEEQIKNQNSNNQDNGNGNNNNNGKIGSQQSIQNVSKPPQRKSKFFEGNNKQKNSSFQKTKEIFKDSQLSMFNIFCPSKKAKEEQELLKFAIHKLGDHLNLHTILNKLMEIEKLKMLLLNEQQQKLFSYIPKPIISTETLKQEKKFEGRQSVNTVKRESCNTQTNGLDGVYKRKSRRLSSKYNNYFLSNVKNQKQQNSEAFDAFKEIGMKKDKDRIDYKILDLMDQELYDDFEKRLGCKIESEIKFAPYQSQRNKSILDTINVPMSQDQLQYQGDHKEEILLGKRPSEKRQSNQTPLSLVGSNIYSPKFNTELQIQYEVNENLLENSKKKQRKQQNIANSQREEEEETAQEKSYDISQIPLESQFRPVPDFKNNKELCLEISPFQSTFQSPRSELE